MVQVRPMNGSGPPRGAAERPSGDRLLRGAVDAAVSSQVVDGELNDLQPGDSHAAITLGNDFEGISASSAMLATQRGSRWPRPKQGTWPRRTRTLAARAGGVANAASSLAATPAESPRSGKIVSAARRPGRRLGILDPHLGYTRTGGLQQSMTCQSRPGCDAWPESGSIYRWKYADLAYPDPSLDPYAAAELRSAHSGDIAYPLPARVLNPREMFKRPPIPDALMGAYRLPVIVRCQHKTTRLDRKSAGSVNAGAAMSAWEWSRQSGTRPCRWARSRPCGRAATLVGAPTRQGLDRGNGGSSP